MAPSGVNDVMRETQAALARWYADTDGTLTTTGSGNAYVLTTNNAHAALADQSFLVFMVDRINSGTSTLNVDGLGAKTIQANKTSLASGYLNSDTIYVVAYNSVNDTYDLLNAKLGLGYMAGQDTISNDDWLGTDLEVQHGGTGASTAGAALTNLAAAPNTLSGVDFTGLTTIEGNALEAGDDFLVMDASVAKRVQYQSGGVIVNAAISTVKTFTSAEMNQVWQLTGATDRQWDLDTGVGVQGNFIIFIQIGTGSVDLSAGTATINTAIGDFTRTNNSVCVGLCTATDTWTFYGDMAAT